MNLGKSILCNKCGNSCTPLSSKKDGFDVNDHGLINASFRSSYHSITEEFGDMMEFKFSICEPCLKVLFDSFVIKPTTCQMMLSQADDLDEFNFVPETPENIEKHLNAVYRELPKFFSKEELLGSKKRARRRGH